MKPGLAGLWTSRRRRPLDRRRIRRKTRGGRKPERLSPPHLVCCCSLECSSGPCGWLRCDRHAALRPQLDHTFASTWPTSSVSCACVFVWWEGEWGKGELSRATARTTPAGACRGFWEGQTAPGAKEQGVPGKRH